MPSASHEAVEKPSICTIERHVQDPQQIEQMSVDDPFELARRIASLLVTDP